MYTLLPCVLTSLCYGVSPLNGKVAGGSGDKVKPPSLGCTEGKAVSYFCVGNDQRLIGYEGDLLTVFLEGQLLIG